LVNSENGQTQKRRELECLEEIEKDQEARDLALTEVREKQEPVVAVEKAALVEVAADPAFAQTVE
jgi:hypothetical protein